MVDGIGLLLRVPVGVQFAAANDSDPDSSYCGNGVCTENEEATWTVGSLVAGASRTIVVNAQVLTTLGAGDAINAPFTFSATGMNPVVLTKVTIVGPPASAELTLGTSVFPLNPGQHFTLDLDVGHVGTVALPGRTLQATLPPGLTVAAASDGGTNAEGKVSWAIGDLAVGAVLHRQLDVTVDPGVPAGTIFHTWAILAQSPGVANDAATEYPLVVASEVQPLKIDVAATPAPAGPDGRLTFVITIGNVLGRAIDKINLLFRVPGGVQFASAGDSEPDSSYCGNGVCTADEEVGWAVGSLAAGASETITVSAQTIPTALKNGSLIWSLFKMSATGIGDIYVAKTVAVHASPGAQLILSTSANPVIAGQAFTYNIDIGQIGTSALANAELRVAIPPGLTVGTISDGGVLMASGDAVWSIASIGIGAILHRTVAATANATAVAGSLYSARASLAYDGGPAVDAMTGYAVPVVGEVQPLTLAVTAAPTPVAPGSRLVYTIVVSNTLARAVDSVVLSLRVPSSVSFAAAADSAPDSSYCANGVCADYEEATWSLGTMAAGAMIPISVNASVAATLLEGSLIGAPFRLTGVGLVDPVQVHYVVPAHR